MECALLRCRNWKAVSEAHIYISAIGKPSKCSSNGRSRTAGAPESQIQTKRQWRRAVRNARSEEATETVSKARAQQSGHKHRCEHSPALCPPCCTTTPERRSVPYSSCFVDWNAVSYDHTRPTRRCSGRALRPRSVAFWQVILCRASFCSRPRAAERQAVSPLPSIA